MIFTYFFKLKNNNKILECVWSHSIVHIVFIENSAIIPGEVGNAEPR